MIVRLLADHTLLSWVPRARQRWGVGVGSVADRAG